MKLLLSLALVLTLVVLTGIPVSAQNIRADGSESGKNIAAIPLSIQGGSAVADPTALRPVVLLDAIFAPTGASLDVTFTLRDAAQVTLLLLDADGNQVLSSVAAVSFTRGEHGLSLRTDDIPAGSYLLRLSASQGLAQRRISLTR